MRIDKLFEPRLFRRTAASVSACCIVFWILFGFDSGFSQLQNLISSLASFLQGKIDLAQLLENIYQDLGLSFHFSAMITYSILFLFISNYLEKLDILGIKNISFSTVIVLMNISLFEIFWMGTYACFQEGMPFMTWLIQDFNSVLLFWGFIVQGTFWFLYFKLLSNLTFKMNNWLLISFLLTLVLVFIWIYYPLPTVSVVIGDPDNPAQFWVSNKLFPQTVYHYPYKAIAYAYIPDNLIHLLNITTKALFAISELIFVRCLGKRVEKPIEERSGIEFAKR